ncbi:formylglycine-generating enzyme family protein [uncultured Tateyamaria sp.]|uniref:formylglycine-generating enzyme family protein n=1 Tax=uncultured Tateyamaria sp. TaxID=455651 RepID=UPI00261113EA|nr:formylglycine-generating enzyme family protein [uncultured Tateyamaria sp.]
MIMLPLGNFVMGAPLAQSEYVYRLWNKPEPGQRVGFEHEGPEHKVRIDLPIAMGRNEVTRAEWTACVVDNGCSHIPATKHLKFGGGYFVVDHALHPILNVSYIDALEYIAWLNKRTGLDVYRLPTEAEWEYAARAGSTTKFGQGDVLTRYQANTTIFEWVGERYKSVPDNRRMPVRVDQLDAANAWGLRHMAGNLSEHTLSCWSERHLSLATSSAYLAEAQRISSCRRVSKGGDFASDAEYARPANRGSQSENSRSKMAGFRVVREFRE